MSTKCQKVKPNLIKKKLRFVKTVFRIISGFLDERLSTITHKKIEKNDTYPEKYFHRASVRKESVKPLSEIEK